MLQSVSWLLLGWAGIYSGGSDRHQGTSTLCEVSHTTVYFQRGGSMSRAASLAGLLWFLTSKAEGCHRGAPQVKYLQRKNDRNCVECTGGNPENLCASFWSNLQRKENPHDLCYFCVLTSVRISFNICEVRIIVPASWGGCKDESGQDWIMGDNGRQCPQTIKLTTWETWENSLLSVRQQFLCLIALCS